MKIFAVYFVDREEPFIYVGNSAREVKRLVARQWNEKVCGVVDRTSVSHNLLGEAREAVVRALGSGEVGMSTTSYDILMALLDEFSDKINK